MKFLAAFFLFIFLVKALRFSDQFVQVQFQSDDSLYLNVTRLKTTFVDDILDCSFTCLQQTRCVSFNLAVVANSEGKFWCELLPSTRYSNPQRLTSNSQSRHFYIQNPCSSEPCLNNGTCSVISFRDGTYKCNCHPGYLGNRCEEEEGTCDCWRSENKILSESGYGYGGSADAIDFQTSGDVILLGYRLWGVNNGSTSFQVTFGLYNGSTLIAQRNGSYPTNSSAKTFEVRFTQGIPIRAGVNYTATAKIKTSSESFSHKDGMGSASCSGVTVTFLESSSGPNGSGVTWGQIPALIFRSSQC